MFRKKIDNIVNCNFIRIFRFLRNCKKETILIFIFGILISLLSLVSPAILGIIIDNLINEKYNVIVILIVVLFVSKLLMLVFQFMFSKLYLIVNKKMVNNIRKDIIDCVLNLEMDDFNNNNRGVFIEKLKNDPNEITKNFNSIKDLLIRGFGNFGLIIYIFILEYRIGLVLCFFTILILYIILLGVRKRKKYMEAYYISQEKYSSVLGEMINSVDEIKQLNLKNNYMQQTISSFKLISENEFKGNYYQRIYGRIASLVEILATMIILFLGIYLYKNNLMDMSSIIIIFMYNSLVFSFVSKIGILMNLISDLNISCNRIFSLLDNHLYTSEMFGDKYKNDCNGSIEFDNVKFKYDNKSNYVLNDCSFKIGSNELVAIVGKSGEGKTTILNLLSRLYCVDDGMIKIDDIDIGEYSEKYIRENISVISQSPYLFDMSIKENLKLVKEDITDKEVKNICKLVCLDEFIESLPNKYDTVIGEGGVKLSGGQKQRLGIARALIKNTKIILLDEITSALDNETGSVIKKVIKNIKKNHTIIVVTHELSMIKDADRILVLENGKIVGDSKHNELLKNNKIYKRLYKIK